jgi:hypothetical protein
MAKIKVSNLEDTILEPINETEVSVITKPKRVRPPRIPVKVVEPPMIEIPPVPQVVTKPRAAKQPRMTTCNNCGKELLEKTFKYYHQLKCKPSSEPKAAPAEKTIEQHHQTQLDRYENNTVDFNYRRSSSQRPVKYASLVSRAF